MQKIKKISLLLLFGLSCSCNYLDIVPDDVATIDNAFVMRSAAEKFLFTCYSYLPNEDNLQEDPAFFAGDECWYYAVSNNPWNIARGSQNIVDPYVDYWDGTRSGISCYKAIRDCNIFLEKIDGVPDLDDFERDRWVAEVNFLKAYYHWLLLQMYGPVPIMDKNLPVSSGTEAVKVERQPVDSCFTYIINLIDSAAMNLPDRIENEATERGRITKGIALAIKARILVNAASPLFNGNPDYASFTDKKGQHLFPSQADPEKWKRAAQACKEAIDFCEAQGAKLYHWEPNREGLSDTTITKMDIRNAITEKWNPEIIWADPNSVADRLQWYSQARLLPEATPNIQSLYAPTLRMAELFYTNHGVPITEDKTWDYTERYSLRTATAADKFDIKEGYQTVGLHFSREPRFYADLGFDGGIWYGQGRFDDKDPYYVQAKMGQAAARKDVAYYSVTGYWPKKLVNFNNSVSTGISYGAEPYPWPRIRLAELYLSYAEALNESQGPVSDVYRYLDMIRERAGIPSVENAWSQYAKDAGKYRTRDGLRDIIHQERLIELAFEGQRFWDLRRWKEAEKVLNAPIMGWNTEAEEAGNYYRVQILYNQRFEKKDYLWPIKEQEMIDNEKLVQNPGW
ncbi:RagB/SusD family nutrient uptake outer membrane protein [Compostibacter hankyongensis]|uniref:RagB/SusD family nutrient uptake outer membrane protein n=1 Tax=Compostibacter hankyongensis TaxID=1007089 RepID=A0ABP8FNF2_9BACT